jgi:nucleoside-diphosphate-sugar epimerase
MRWRGKRVLVTGGASFLGSHLVDKLVELNANVRVADDFSSGKVDNLTKSIDYVEVLKGDLKDRCFAESAMKDVDLVFHLAASHGGRGYIDTHPAECCLNMVLDGIVFESAFKAGVERICFASSACVYPTNLQSKKASRQVLLLKEDMADPFSSGKALADGEYGWAKLMGEMTLKAYHNEYGMKCSNCRIFTAYGERENETHAIMALIARTFIKMDPYVIWGTGEQDRNFTYVSDIIEGFILAMEKIIDGTPVNIGTSEHIKIAEAAEKIFEYTGFRPRNILFDISKSEGVFSRAADISKTKKILDWEPKVLFDDGLKRTIDWYYATKNKDDVAQKLHTLLYER